MVKNNSVMEQVLIDGTVLEYTTHLNYKFKFYYDKKILKYVIEWIERPPVKNVEKYKDIKSKNFNKVYRKKLELDRYIDSEIRYHN